MPRKTRKQLAEANGENEELIQRQRDLGCKLLAWSLHRQWRLTQTSPDGVVSQRSVAKS